MSYIDNEILKIFINVYELKTSNSINETIPNLNISLNKENIPNKMVNIFFSKAKDYIPYILENALIYAILYDIPQIIDNYDTLKNNINLISLLDDELKYNILVYSIKFILDKKNNKINNKDIFSIKETYNKMFIYIENNYKIDSLFNLYRNIIFDVFNKLKLDFNEKTLEKILLSNKYDQILKKVSNDFIENENDLIFFKKFFIRILLYDAYLFEYYINNKVLEDMTNDENFPIKLSKDTLKSILSTPILDYINECIKNNSYSLPKNIKLRTEILRNFFHTNLHDKYKLIELVEKENVLVLKKLNPLYKVDKYN